MRTGTINTYIKFSKNFGGVRKCYEGKPTIAVGGFSCETALLPVNGAVMAAGTPVYADEQARTIVPLYTFKVKSVDSTNSKITVEKYETGSVAKVGMKLLVVGNDLTSTRLQVTLTFLPLTRLQVRPQAQSSPRLVQTAKSRLFLTD